MQSDPRCAAWRGGGSSESFGVPQKKNPSMFTRVWSKQRDGPEY